MLERYIEEMSKKVGLLGCTSGLCVSIFPCIIQNFVSDKIMR